MDSLRPDEALMNSYVDGDKRARAIVESWKPTFPTTLMTSEELDATSERCRVTFSFPRNNGREPRDA
jgi:hypothetical protein